MSNNCQLDKEINYHIQSAAQSVSNLNERVFNSRELTKETKIKVYKQCVIPMLTYGCETWPI